MIIYGVKLLGFESPRGIRFTRAALADAAKLYENIEVEENVGVLRNVRVGKDGLYADLHLTAFK